MRHMKMLPLTMTVLGVSGCAADGFPAGPAALHDRVEATQSFADVNGATHELVTREREITPTDTGVIKEWQVDLDGEQRHVTMVSDLSTLSPDYDGPLLAIRGGVPFSIEVHHGRAELHIDGKLVRSYPDHEIRLEAADTELLDRTTRGLIERLTHGKDPNTCIVDTLDPTAAAVPMRMAGGWCTTCIWSCGLFCFVWGEGTSCNYITCPIRGCISNGC